MELERLYPAVSLALVTTALVVATPLSWSGGRLRPGDLYHQHRS